MGSFGFINKIKIKANDINLSTSLLVLLART